MVAGVIGAAIAALASLVYMRAIWKYTINRAALGVVRALRRHPDRAYTVQVHKWVPTVGAWNSESAAAAPSAGLRRRDRDLPPRRHRSGDTDLEHHASGNNATTPRDIPPQIDTGEPEQHKRALMLRLIAIVYAVAAVGGFIAGYTVSSGTAGRRVGFGLAGVFVAMVVLWLVVTAIISRPRHPESARTQTRARHRELNLTPSGEYLQRLDSRL